MRLEGEVIVMGDERDIITLAGRVYRCEADGQGVVARGRLPGLDTGDLARRDPDGASAVRTLAQ